MDDDEMAEHRRLWALADFGTKQKCAATKTKFGCCFLQPCCRGEFRRRFWIPTSQLPGSLRVSPRRCASLHLVACPPTRIKIFGPEGQKLPRINNCRAMPWEDPQASHTQMKKNVTQPPKQILNIYPGDHTPVGTGNITADACQDLTQPTQVLRTRDHRGIWATSRRL